MGRRKQVVPRKSDNLEDQSPNNQDAAGSPGGVTADSDGSSDSTEDPELRMSLLEPQPDLHHHQQSRRSPPTFSSSMFYAEAAASDNSTAGSTPAHGGLMSLDALKSNPFLLPAPLLALNPALYAAQLAQLQAAQLLLAKQSLDSGAGGAASDRKRSAEDESFSRDLVSKAKYPRMPDMVDQSQVVGGQPESPLDLSGSRSPENSAAKTAATAQAAFTAFLPPNIISFLSQLKSCAPSGALAAGDLSSLFGIPVASAAASKISDNPSPPPSAVPAAGSATAGRSNPWQSQWMTRAADGGQISDVFKCVWCRESYHTLEALTRHMKEAKHHHIAMPGSSAAANFASSSSQLPSGGGRTVPTASPARLTAPPTSASPSASSATSPPKSSPPARDILKEQLPLPRKLVRGQDVWIGRADQQTRDILKCMGCGQSFRSLDLLTKHMQETQHYKKVISHDQLSSWKYQDSHQPGASPSHKNHVNSVLSCKVCEKGFGTLKELSDHMVRANHFSSEANVPGNKGGLLLRSPVVATAVSNASALAKERKKALPVKKLLELERARQEVGGASGSKAAASAQEILESGKLFCERCEERIPLDLFISHIQHCVGKSQQHFGFLSGQVKQEYQQPGAAATPSSSPESGRRVEAGNSNNSSILGSLEQLVKGNFQPRPTAGSGSDRKFAAPVASPPVLASPSTGGGLLSPLPNVPLSQHTGAAFNRFSIQSMVSTASGEQDRSGEGDGGRSDAARTLPSPAPSRASSSGANSPRERQPQEEGGPPTVDLSPSASPASSQPGKQDGSHQMDGGAGSPLSATTTNASSPLNGEINPPASLSPNGKAGSPVCGGTNGVSDGQAAFRLPIIKSESVDSVAATAPAEKSNSSSCNPLAALQMLCDTQKKMPKIQNSGGAANSRTSEGISRSSSMSPLSDPGAILAFSWACNQAVAAADQSSVIKCPFCETPFISKGAYRHHLSKVHFTKESQVLSAAGGGSALVGGQRTTPSPQDTKDEEEASLQSKYQKYAQMARQLSCNQK